MPSYWVEHSWRHFTCKLSEDSRTYGLIVHRVFDLDDREVRGEYWGFKPEFSRINMSSDKENPRTAR